MAAIEEETKSLETMEQFYKIAKYPLVKYSDMVEELRSEAMELVVSGAEKYAPFEPVQNRNYEAATKFVKENMDKKFAQLAPWNVVMGESMGFEISHQVKNVLHVYCLGYLSCVVWKG